MRSQALTLSSMAARKPRRALGRLEGLCGYARGRLWPGNSPAVARSKASRSARWRLGQAHWPFGYARRRFSALAGASPVLVHDRPKRGPRRNHYRPHRSQVGVPLGVLRKHQRQSHAQSLCIGRAREAAHAQHRCLRGNHHHQDAHSCAYSARGRSLRQEDRGSSSHTGGFASCRTGTVG
jgi:hypothetical protein